MREHYPQILNENKHVPVKNFNLFGNDNESY